MTTVTTEEQAPIPHTDLTDPNLFPPYTAIQHSNPNPMQLRDQPSMQPMQIRSNHNAPLSLQPGLAPYQSQHLPQPPFHEQQPQPPPQQMQPQTQPLPQPQTQTQPQPYQQCPSPITHIKLSPKTPPSKPLLFKYMFDFPVNWSFPNVVMLDPSCFYCIKRSLLILEFGKKSKKHE